MNSHTLKIGDRLKLTKDGIESFRRMLTVHREPKYTKDSRATVVGFSRTPYLVKLRLDGYREAENHHMIFWKRV